MAWHPAARDEPAAPRRSPPRRLAFLGGVWVLLVVPVALLLFLAVEGLTEPALVDQVETFGAGDVVADGRSRPTTTLAPSTSTPLTGTTSAAPGRVAPWPTPAPSDDVAPGRSGPQGAPPPGESPPVDRAPAPPPPRVPGSPDDCKHGGWRDLVDDEGRPFANQGGCIGYAHAAS